MERLVYVLAGILLFIVSSCNTSNASTDKGVAQELIMNSKPKDVIRGDKVNIRVYDYDGLEGLLNRKDDITYVVNFWATWCKPCVEELPYFEELNAKYAGENVEVVLVSLDFPSRAKELLIPFVEKKNIKSDVLLLDDPRQNTWIPKIDEQWSGAIPATLIFNKDKREFYEKSFNFNELENNLLSFIN